MTTNPDMPTTQTIFAAIERDDLDAMRTLLDADPMLAHARHADAERHHWTTLQFAAANGQLEACKLLVERGAEVYTNPFNTYPPVIQAAWNRHQEVVGYFLMEIPERADGTNRCGVALNLASGMDGDRAEAHRRRPTERASAGMDRGYAPALARP